MTHKNKYLYLFVIQGFYDRLYGWEDLTAEETYRDAKYRLAEYRANEPENHHRMIRRRELNTELEV